MGQPPIPKWRPTVGVDIERTTKAFAYYLDGKHPFAVLKHGTCVGLPPQSSDPQAAAAGTMHAILNAHPDAKLRTMDDGHYVVWYSQPAAGVLFSDVVKANWKYIEDNHLDGFTPGEVIRKPDGSALQLTEGVKMTLFARARMFMDAVSPNIVKIWRPKDEHS